jgi:hypothetical protein
MFRTVVLQQSLVRLVLGLVQALGQLQPVLVQVPVLVQLQLVVR